MGWLGRTLFPSISKWFAIRRLVRDTNPDVIISFLTNENVVVLFATRGLGVPVVVCERTNPAFSSSAGPFLQRLRRLSYPWADSVVLQSQDSLAAFQQMVPRLQNLDVVHNPMPTDLRDINLGKAR